MRAGHKSSWRSYSRISRVAWTPSTSGIWMSHHTRLGRNSLKRSMACAPPLASENVTFFVLRNVTRIRRAIGLSSTTRTRAGEEAC